MNSAGNDVFSYEMRRKDRELPQTEAENLLLTGEYGTLAVTTPANTPYMTPVNYVYKTEENAIYIHCSTEGLRLKCIALNTSVCFSVVTSAKVISGFTSLYESVTVFGHSTLLSDDTEKEKALIMLCEKYYPKLSAHNIKKFISGKLGKTSVIKICIDKLTGKANRLASVK